jgi:uncharacterized pyridoxal phosphate-containing UPF0001 family protein
LLVELIVEKAGVEPGDTVSLVKYVRDECPHLEFTGLMTIGAAAASHSATENQKNPDFEVFETLAAPTDRRH